MIVEIKFKRGYILKREHFYRYDIKQNRRYK